MRLKLETILGADFLETPFGVTPVTTVDVIVVRRSEDVIQLLGLSLLTHEIVLCSVDGLAE